MTVRVVNAQHEAPVDVARMRRLAAAAMRKLGIRQPGAMDITFITAGRMRRLNGRFKRHDWTTDVLSFRYDGKSFVHDGKPLLGEVLIAPAFARRYARDNGIDYREELSRYVVHGLLHWKGYDDRTTAQQKMMRSREDRLLRACGIAR